MPNKFLTTVTVLVLLLCPAGVRAETLKYAVYASGFEVVNLQTIIVETPKTYKAVLDAGLHGWLKKLAPWYGRIETTGAQPALPRSHIFTSSWKGKVEKTRFSFERGQYVSGSKTESDGKVTPLPKDPELTRGAVDVVTTLYMAMRKLNQTGSCALSQKAYDGRRSFLMIYRDAGDVTLKKTKLNPYAGPAKKCTVELKPLAGKWHDKPRGWLSVQEQSRLKGQLPTITFGKLLAKGGYAPVKAELQTRYGAAVLHLVSVTK